MANIKTGTIVKLKTGGPNMTADSTDKQGYVRCLWFVNDKLEVAGYLPDSLVIVDDSEGKKK